jgi:Domain of unknown function (DUF5615)
VHPLLRSPRWDRILEPRFPFEIPGKISSLVFANIVKTLLSHWCNVIEMAWKDIREVVSTRPPTQREKRQVNDYIRRKAKPRFYADEDLPAAATAILRRMNADVYTAEDARRRGQPDENHLEEAQKLGRVLITCDRDYLDERRFPLIHCPAIVVCDFGSGTLAEILDVFSCLHGIFRAPQFFDKWTKIEAKRHGWTEYARFQDGSTSRMRFRVYRGRVQEWVSG